jgi:hypothetical protein
MDVEKITGKSRAKLVWRYIQNLTKQLYGLLIVRRSSIIAFEISNRGIESCRNIYSRVKETKRKKGKEFL